MAMIKCPECGKEISDLAEKCPNCGFPIGFQSTSTPHSQNNSYSVNENPQQNRPQYPQNQPVQVHAVSYEKAGNSGLGIAALILSILGCTFVLGAIFAIIDLCKKDNRKKTLSIIALCICGFWLLISIVATFAKDETPTKVADTAINSSVEVSNVSDVTQDNSDDVTNDAHAEEPVSNDENTEDSVFKKGEIAELNGVQVTLTEYKESTGGDWNKPTDGNVFLMAEFEISNNTEKELSISSIMSFDAYADDYSLNYSFSALMDNNDTQLDGTIAAGKKMKGWIGWEVPVDYQNVEIHFTDNVWSDNKFVFLIEK